MTNELLEKIDSLLAETSFLFYDWNDLEWDTNGCPDGEKCEEFSTRLARIAALSSEVAKLKNRDKISA